MYDIQLQQAVFSAVLYRCELYECAYIRPIVEDLISDYDVPQWDLNSFYGRVRRMLKKLTQADILEEHEGELNIRRTARLYYTIKSDFIMFGMFGKKGTFKGAAANTFLSMLGGPEGVVKLIGSLLINHEDKIAGFIQSREAVLKKQSDKIYSDSAKVQLGITQANNQLIIMEQAMEFDEESKTMKCTLLNKFTVPQFLDLIKTSIENAKQGDKQPGGIEGGEPGAKNNNNESTNTEGGEG